MALAGLDLDVPNSAGVRRRTESCFRGPARPVTELSLLWFQVQFESAALLVRTRDWRAGVAGAPHSVTNFHTVTARVTAATFNAFKIMMIDTVRRPGPTSAKPEPGPAERPQLATFTGRFASGY